MISSLRLEFGTTRQVLPNTCTENAAESGNINPCPIANLAESANNPLETDHAIISNLIVQSGTVNHPPMDKEDTEKIGDFFAGFSGVICTVGNDNNPLVPSVVAGLNSASNEGGPTIGKFTFSVIAQSINEAYSAFTSFIGPNGDQLARIAFSAISAISAGMRSLFPIVKEALTTLQDSHSVLAVISLALAAGHVVLSSIATLMATKNFPPALTGNNETSELKNMPNDLEDSFKSFLEEIGKKFDAFTGKGLIGALGAVREWLMLSSAVVSLFNVLPIVIKTIAPIISAPIAAIVGGSINLVAAIVELVQGVNEYTSLGDDLRDLNAKLDHAKAESSVDEIVKLNADIENKENELSASKVRIGKALIGIATSVASIVLGVLAIAVSISVPVLPAVLASLSVLTVAVYVVVTIAVRLNRLQKAEEAKQSTKPLSYSSDTEDSLSGEEEVISVI